MSPPSFLSSMSRRRKVRNAPPPSSANGSASFTRLLYVRAPSPARVIARRAGFVLAALLLAIAIFWWERHNLHDTSGGTPGLADVVYFTLVTVTTVGYGDIVPVGERARLLDALVVTPIRLFVWLMFLGTAYEFFWQRIVEDRRMKQLQKNLGDHIIICGYGYSGSSAARLLASSEQGKHIVVVDTDPDRLEEAAQHGLIGLRGDCTRDVVLKQAGIDTAHAILFCIRHDEVAALAILTARNLNANIRIMAMVNDEENVRLLQRAGAQEVVAPSRLAGFLMADAVRSRYTTRFIGDLLAGSAGFLRIAERPAKPAEVGKAWREVPGALIVAVERAGKVMGFWEPQTPPLEEGDLIFAIEANPHRAGEIQPAPPL